MKSLVKLDVSHNELTTLLDFQPPKNLVVSQYVKFYWKYACLENAHTHTPLERSTRTPPPPLETITHPLESITRTPPPPGRYHALPLFQI